MTEQEDVVGEGKGKSDREIGTRLTATKNEQNEQSLGFNQKHNIKLMSGLDDRLTIHHSSYRLWWMHITLR